jgi:hypothetical protein
MPAQTIDVPGHGLVEFPEGMDDAAIVKAIKGLDAPAQGGGSPVHDFFFGGSTGAGGSFARATQNLPGSAEGVATGLWNAITHPVDTAKSLWDEASSGFPALRERYGTVEKFQKTFETDPAGTMLDAFTLGKGGSALVRKGGELGARGARAALPTIGAATSKASAADLRMAGEAGLKGGREAAEYQAGAAGKPLTSEIKPTASFDDPLPAGLDMGGEGSLVPRGGIKASTREAAEKALAAQREAAQAELAPYGQAGRRIGAAGADPTSIVIGGLTGGRLGTAAAATAASPRAVGSAMYGLGAAGRGLAGTAGPPTRAAIAAGAAALLKDRETKKELPPADVKTLRAATRDDAGSATMLAASRILGARPSPYGGSDIAPQYGGIGGDRVATPSPGQASMPSGGPGTGTGPAPGSAGPGPAAGTAAGPGAPPPGAAGALAGSGPLPLPGQSPGLSRVQTTGQEPVAETHGGQTFLQAYWDHLLKGGKEMAKTPREAYRHGLPLEQETDWAAGMALNTMGTGAFAAKPGALGVAGGRITQPGVEVAEKNMHGLVPDLRVKVGVEPSLLPEKPLFTQNTTNANAPKQLEAINTVLKEHPAPEASPEAWSQMMAHALGSDEVPVPPYAFIRDINGEGAIEKIKSLTPGQIKDADHGFDNARRTRAAYEAGRVDPAQTGKLFLWSFLSRGVSPYTQESLFIDAFSRVDPWIKKAVEGKFTAADVPAFKQAMADVAPKGSGQPGAGAQHNLNAFGANFLLKMGERGADGKTHLQRMHDLLSDPNKTGQQIRREFSKISEGVGIDNKVMSFTLLVAGHPDVMVLDRVQMRQLWDDGRFAGRNIYDGMKDAKGNVITGTPMSTMTYGARGLLQYEAIERALGKRIKDIYTAAGRPQDASIGRYHWESWVAHSQQEASHGTLEAVMDPSKLAKTTAKEGEYGSYQYGARYGRDRGGTPYFAYSTPSGKVYNFSIPSFRSFLEEIKKPAAGVVPPKFKVTEAGNAPWYRRPEVNKAKLEAIARKWASQ